MHTFEPNDFEGEGQHYAMREHACQYTAILGQSFQWAEACVSGGRLLTSEFIDSYYTSRALGAAGGNKHAEGEALSTLPGELRFCHRG